MILYDPGIPSDLLEFGIQIPVRNSRTTNTFAALKNHPALGPRVRNWHKDRIDTRIVRDDLERVHTPAYVSRIYGDSLKETLLATYELIAPDGSYHRYAPDKATRPGYL